MGIRSWAEPNGLNPAWDQIFLPVNSSNFSIPCLANFVLNVIICELGGARLLLYSNMPSRGLRVIYLAGVDFLAGVSRSLRELD